MNINWFFLSSFSLSLTTLFLIVILLRFGREKVHQAWMLCNFFTFIWALGATLASLNSSSISFVNWSLRIADIGVTFIPVLALHFFYLLTNKINKGILIFVYLQAIIFSVLFAKTNFIAAYPYQKIYNTILYYTAGKIYFLWFGFLSAIMTYAHLILIKFYLDKRNKEKDNLTLLLIAASCAFICGTANFFYFLNFSLFQFANLGIVVYCLIVTYAIFRHQLLGIEVIYKKGLLYSMLIAILTGIYLLLILIVEGLFRGFMGYKSYIVSLLAAFTIAILFNPLRNRLQAFVDKIFLGKTSQEIAHENELLRQELERSERLKTASTLALGLAHEIKNPLTTIKTFSEFLPQRSDDKEFLNKFARLVPGEVERINNIVHQLLDFSKPAPPSFQKIKISRLIDDTLMFLSNDFLKRNISIAKSYEDPELEIKVDPAQIKQAFLNLILNAMEAMVHGGCITIKTQTRQAGFFEIRIQDEGCGIAKEDLKHIFDPFFSTKDSGTGLGLAIVHQIIKNHHGTVAAESEIGKGTQFVIKLPL